LDDRYGVSHDTGVFDGVGKLVGARAVGQGSTGGQADSETKGNEPGRRLGEGRATNGLF
jgi:hypothetical protein